MRWLNQIWHGSPKRVYWHNADKVDVHCSDIFRIEFEDGGLRVSNDYVNCLYGYQSEHQFCKDYNSLRRCLNLDESVDFDISPIEERILTHLIFNCLMQNKKVRLRPSDLTHPTTIGLVNNYLEKLGCVKEEQILQGSKILRMKEKTYRKHTYHNDWFEMIK